MQGHIHTRPERTREEIEADKEEADRFYVRLSTGHWGPTGITRERFLRAQSYDCKVLVLVREMAAWMEVNSQFPTDQERAQRHAARVAAEPLLRPRVESELREYVSRATRAGMPAPRLHSCSAEERREMRASGSGWRFTMRQVSDMRKARIIHDADIPFTRWLLVHPSYGPVRPAVTPVAPHRPTSVRRYVPGEVRPAGLTPERALSIAIRALGLA